METTALFQDETRARAKVQIWRPQTLDSPRQIAPIWLHAGGAPTANINHRKPSHRSTMGRGTRLWRRDPVWGPQDTGFENTDGAQPLMLGLTLPPVLIVENDHNISGWSEERGCRERTRSRDYRHWIHRRRLRPYGSMLAVDPTARPHLWKRPCRSRMRRETRLWQKDQAWAPQNTGFGDMDGFHHLPYQDYPYHPSSPLKITTTFRDGARNTIAGKGPDLGCSIWVHRYI